MGMMDYLLVIALLSSYKNIISIFGLIITTFFLLFCFNLCKMIDGEYSPEV